MPPPRLRVLFIWHCLLGACASSGFTPSLQPQGDADDGRSASSESDRFPRCSCADASLCRPLSRKHSVGKDVHVYSDCGGPWISASKSGNTSCDWRQFDFNKISTIVRMAGHPVSVASDGQVVINNASSWPDSELLCHAHAHDVRVLAVVLPDGRHGAGSKGHTEGYYKTLLSNSSAVQRMATELAEAVNAAAFDGVEFDFESMSAEAVDYPSFDYGTAHVAMIKAVKAAFDASSSSSSSSSSVMLTMGAANLTNEGAKSYLACYPIPELADASDGIFIMSYGALPASVVHYY